MQWAVVALVVGTALLAYGPNVFAGASDLAGANAGAGLGVLNFVLTLAGNVAFPIGAALLGAAIVIQTLTPGGDPGGAGTPGRQQSRHRGSIEPS